MNSLQRLVARMREIWATARGYEIGTAAPLPPPIVPPRTAAAELIAEAEGRGAADAQANMQDSWSFGGPDDPVSEDFDPPYVHVLRRRCAAAVATVRANRGLTGARLEHVERWRAESERGMAAARTMMSGVAVREARLIAETQRRSRNSYDINEAELVDTVNATARPDEMVWEGETVVLGRFWRALVLLGLFTATVTVEYTVFGAWFAGTSGADPVAIPVAALLVGSPYLAALLFRGRRSTGSERWIGRVVLLLALPWLSVALIVGVSRGAMLAGAAQSHLTLPTMIVLFVALLLIAGAMAFMLGLARRHPFQEAYVRHRAVRNRLDVLRRAMADRINPAYLDPETDRPSAVEEERAVMEAYAAAEHAYFAALVRAVGDPTFTEAVQGRRGLRPQAQRGAGQSHDGLRAVG